MLFNILLSVFLIPALGANYFNFDGFLNLDNSAILSFERFAPQRIYTDYLDVKIAAQSAIAVDVKSGKILYKKNPDDVRPIGSITKLMAASVFLDNNPGWSNEFYLKNEDRRSGGIIYINNGEVLTIRDLFYTALVVSDNDAIMGLVRSTGISEEKFVELMNKKAQELGLTNTQFSDPTGLSSGNKSTASDITKLLNIALANPAIQKATSLDKYGFTVKYSVKGVEKTRDVKIGNTDLLLGGYLNVIGGKTGHVEEAGYCFATKIKGEKNQDVIIVVLGSDSNFNRFQDVKAVADWIFSNYNWQ
ncbi:MAG: serine hydrolase [Patescibacteria group bacterium]|nr:serine hydrolase [Patescibacteria group bacterium]